MKYIIGSAQQFSGLDARQSQASDCVLRFFSVFHGTDQCVAVCVVKYDCWHEFSKEHQSVDHNSVTADYLVRASRKIQCPFKDFSAGDAPG